MINPMHNCFRKLLIFITLCLLPALEGAQPPFQIDAADTHGIMHTILKDHVIFENLSAPLMRRILNAFLEELDATRVYLIESSLKPYLNPSDQLLEEMSQRIENQDFSDFYTLLKQMQSSIERMDQLAKAEYQPSASCLKSLKEAKDLSWGKTYQELYQRQRDITELHLQSAVEFDIDTRERMQKRLDKLKRRFEASLSTNSAQAFTTKAHELFLKAFTKSLDDHSTYFTPWEAQEYARNVQQHLVGIGAQLRDDLEGITLVHILENSPTAKHGGIKVGDMIVAVDHEPVIGMDIEEAVKLIRGPKGTKVSLTLLRGPSEKKEKLEVEIIRDRIVFEEARFNHELLPFGAGKLAYFRLFSFYQDEETSSEKDIQQVLEKAIAEHPLKGVLLDLRSNGGGLLTQAAKVAGLFMKKGIVASIKDGQGHMEHYRTFRATPVWDGPLVILTDRASASAAEIVASSLQDYGRAIVVGDEKTWGKGSYQIFTFNPNASSIPNPLGEYKVTKGLYYTVSGLSPQLTGVCADIVVPGGLKAEDIGESLMKHPIEKQRIEPHFIDKLEDVHPFFRAKMKRQYKHNRQEKLAIYEPLLPTLKSNSAIRLKQNPDFQNFLKILNKDKITKKDLSSYGLRDLVKAEGVNILKDLILMQLQQDKAA